MIDQLLESGVVVPDPASVVIGPEVKAGRIAPGAVLHPGTRLEGEHISIGAGSEIGHEGPAVVRNCRLGRKVTLGSGFFDGSVFLDGASMGGNAHVRPGCLLEEQSSGAHAAGLKQTVLLPYVTLGSLINFCDILMAGGTSRKNHSEVGSSYIHFNYTPHQDKATASLVGDVVQGVLLNQRPIFLGGQGGLVGPARIAYGTVVAAGHVVRRDIEMPGQLVVPPSPAPGAADYDPRGYGRVERLVRNNLAYIGNIRALRAWYQFIRAPFMTGDPFSAACREGALEVLDLILAERIRRLGEVAGKMQDSIDLHGQAGDAAAAETVRQQRQLADSWPAMREGLDKNADPPPPEGLAAAARGAGGEYLAWVAGLGDPLRRATAGWLGGIVDDTVSLWKA